MKNGIKRIFAAALACVMIITTVLPAGVVFAENNKYPTGKEMFHVKVGTLADQYLGQKVTLTQGKTYNLSFKMKIVSGKLEGKSTDNIQVSVRDYKSSGGYETERFSSKGTGTKAMPISVDADTYEYSCSFTYDVDTTTITNYATYKTWVGIIATKASDVEYYVTDFKLVENGTETNKMSGIDNFHSNPSNWTICKWQTAPTDTSKVATNFAVIDETYSDNKAKKLTINTHTIEILDKSEIFTQDEEYPTGNEMFHVKVGTLADQYLGQKVTLTQGKTYNMSFKMKIVSGKLEGKSTDNIQVSVRDFKSSGGYETERFSSKTSGVNATPIDAEAGTYEYSCSFTYNVDTATITNYATYKTWVGIIATKASGVEYYVTDFKLVENGTETNKMSGIDNFHSNPSNWTICKWQTAPTDTSKVATNFAVIDETYSDNKAKKLTINTHTIEILDKGETFTSSGSGGNEPVGEEYPTGNEMFHVKVGTLADQYLGQKVTLTQGKTYNMSFKMKIVSGKLEGKSTDNIQVSVRDYKSSGGYETERFTSKTTEISTTPINAEAGTYDYSFSFTYNVDTTTITNYATYKTWVGIIATKASDVEYYVTDFVLKEAETDTNKMSGVDNFHSNPSNWTICKWSTAPTDTSKVATNFAVIDETYSDNKAKKLTINTHTIEILDKGETFTSSGSGGNEPVGEEYPTGNEMFHVKVGTLADQYLGQKVTLTQGKTYNMSFKMKIVKGTFKGTSSDNIQVTVRDYKTSGGYETERFSSKGTGSKAMPITVDASTYEYSCSFTYNVDTTTITDYATYKTWVGIIATKASDVEYYVTDFKLVEDGTDTNKMSGIDNFHSNPSNWTISKWQTAPTDTSKVATNFAVIDETYSDNKAKKLTINTHTIEILDKGETFVPKEPEPDNTPVTHMIKVTTDNISSASTLQQVTTLKYGTRYILTLQVSDLIELLDDGLKFQIRQKGSSGAYSKTIVELDENYIAADLNNGIYTYEFTWTEATSNNCGIGFTYPSNKKHTMYIADMSLCEKGEVTNLLNCAGENKNTLTGWVNEWNVQGNNPTATGFVHRYVVELVDYDKGVFKGNGGVVPEKENSMICLKLAGVEEQTTFQKVVKLENGKTYTLTFEASEFLKTLKSGDVTLGIIAKGTSGMFDVVSKDLGTGYSKADVSKGKYEYSFTWDGETAEYGIGFTFPTKKEMTMYIANMKLTEKGSSKNLLPGTDMMNSMKGWGTENPDVTAKKHSVGILEYKIGDKLLYTAKLTTYEPQRFEPIIEHGMIHLTSSAAKPESKSTEARFVQSVSLEKGETYTVTFRYKALKGGINNGVLFKVMGDPTTISATTGKADLKNYKQEAKVGDFEVEHDKENCTMTYKFTCDMESKTYHVGFGFYGEVDMYIADFGVYASSNPKVNLAPASQKQSDLEGWSALYERVKEGATLFEVSTESGDKKKNYTARLMEFDADIFVPTKYDHMMIYLDASEDKYKSVPVFGQNVNLVKGEKYTIEYKYKFKSGEMDTSIWLTVKDKLGSGKYKDYLNSKKKNFEVSNDKKNMVMKYTFTWQEESGQYAVAFQINGKTQMYIADFAVYNVKKPNNNLCPQADNPESLYGWRADWKAAESDSKSFESNKYKVSLLKYDASIFVPDPILPNKMIYFENINTYHTWCQRVKLEPGKTYRFSFGLATNMPPDGVVMTNGERRQIFRGLKPINNPDYKQDSYEVVYEFTMPSTFEGKPLTDTNVFVGIQFTKGAIAYMFNPKLWDVSDKTQENLFKNPDYNKGMDNWALSWGAWFLPEVDGTGVQSFEKDGSFKLQVMSYDESKFITYYDDERFNDGEWWNADDIAGKEVKRNSRIKGRLVDANGKAIANQKLLLISKTETLEVITDEKGRFDFKNLAAGFYEISIDDNGTILPTEFATNVKAGYTLNVKLIYDGNSVRVAVVPWAVAVSVGVPVLATVALGTVYVLKKKRKEKLA